jgi:hypothetical protein
VGILSEFLSKCLYTCTIFFSIQDWSSGYIFYSCWVPGLYWRSRWFHSKFWKNWSIGNSILLKIWTTFYDQLLQKKSTLQDILDITHMSDMLLRLGKQWMIGVSTVHDKLVIYVWFLFFLFDVLVIDDPCNWNCLSNKIIFDFSEHFQFVL